MPFPDKTFDFLNLSLSLHYTSYIPSKGKLERLQLIREMNRVLEIGGRAVLTLIYSYGLKNPDMFREAVKEFGFEVNEDWTGEATSGSSFQALVITLEKQKDIEEDLNVEELSARLGKEKREGFKFAEQKGRLRDSRRILTGVELRGRTLPIRLSREDQEAFEEEQTILKQGEALRDEHGDIAKIPREKVIRNGFVRIRSGEKYLLFRKLEKGSGAVLIR
jgi:SAM-dependent methyltransferase